VRMRIIGLWEVAAAIAVSAQTGPVTRIGGQVSTVLGRLALSPQYQIVAVEERSATHVYRVMNLGALPVRLQVRPIEWTLDEHDQMVERPSSDDGIAQWIVVSPTVLEIPPGESRAVRFALRPPSPPASGEHLAGLALRQQAEGIASTNSEGFAIQTEVEIRTAIYVTAGEVRRTGKIVAFDLKPDRLRVRVENTGTAHVRFEGHYQIWAADSYPGLESAIERRGNDREPIATGPLLPAPVLAGRSRWLDHPLSGSPLAPGRYTVVAHGTLGEERLQVAQTLEVAAPP